MPVQKKSGNLLNAPRTSIRLVIREDRLHTYNYISAHPNEVQGQSSTSTLTEEGELRFPTQNMSQTSLNVNNYYSTKQDWRQNFLKMGFFQYCI